MGVSVGSKTTRERLLDLLRRRVKTKRPRLSSKSAARVPSNSDVARRRETHPEGERNETLQESSAGIVDYNIYADSMLVNLLQTVGVDTRGFDKDALVQSCKTYSDLCMCFMSFMYVARLISDELIWEWGHLMSSDTA